MRRPARRTAAGGVRVPDARVHLKLDDDFPRSREALLGIVYPHFIRPIPSMSIVEFQVDVEHGKLTTGLKIPKDSLLYSRPVNGVPCKFRTCYDTTLWPLTVTAAEWKQPGPPASSLKLYGCGVSRLRAGIALARRYAAAKLDWITCASTCSVRAAWRISCTSFCAAKLTRIVVRDPANPKLPPVRCRRPACGPWVSARTKAMLPYPRRSFTGYRLLQEYFTMPEKFLFVDVTGLAGVWEQGSRTRSSWCSCSPAPATRTGGNGSEIGISPKTSGWAACR